MRRDPELFLSTEQLCPLAQVVQPERLWDYQEFRVGSSGDEVASCGAAIEKGRHELSTVELLQPLDDLPQLPLSVGPMPGELAAVLTVQTSLPFLP